MAAARREREIVALSVAGQTAPAIAAVLRGRPVRGSPVVPALTARGGRVFFEDADAAGEVRDAAVAAAVGSLDRGTPRVFADSPWGVMTD